MSGEGASIMGRFAFPDPQGRVFEAIERARFAIGIVAPLSQAETAAVRVMLAALGVHYPGDGSAPIARECEIIVDGDRWACSFGGRLAGATTIVRFRSGDDAPTVLP